MFLLFLNFNFFQSIVLYLAANIFYYYKHTYIILEGSCCSIDNLLKRKYKLLSFTYHSVSISKRSIAWLYTQRLFEGVSRSASEWRSTKFLREPRTSGGGSVAVNRDGPNRAESSSVWIAFVSSRTFDRSHLPPGGGGGETRSGREVSVDWYRLLADKISKQISILFSFSLFLLTEEFLQYTRIRGFVHVGYTWYFKRYMVCEHIDFPPLFPICSSQEPSSSRSVKYTYIYSIESIASSLLLINTISFVFVRF